MGLLTDAVYGLVAAATSPLWGWRMYRTGKWRTDWKERFGQVKIASDPAADRRPTLLIHAVSVGEVNAIRQLVEQLDEVTSGSWRIIISTTTAPGSSSSPGMRWCVIRWISPGV
jgi:3-deoxy-D-manno-octulosonic-acid transferase